MAKAGMTRSDFTIVAALTAHAGAIARLETQCFDDPMNEATLKRQIAEPVCRFFVALTPEKEAAGYIGLTVVLDEGYVVNVAVSPDYRRLGVGKSLLKAAVELGERERLSFVTLEVRESNQAAIALYSGLGFVRVGIRNKYYVNEDAILMTYYYDRAKEQ